MHEILQGYIIFCHSAKSKSVCLADGEDNMELATQEEGEEIKPHHTELLHNALKSYFGRQLRLPGEWQNLSQIQFPPNGPGSDPLVRLFCKWDGIELQNIYLSYHRLRYEQQRQNSGPTAASTAVFQGKKVMRFRPLKQSVASAIKKKKRAAKKRPNSQKSPSSLQQ